MKYYFPHLEINKGLPGYKHFSNKKPFTTLHEACCQFDTWEEQLLTYCHLERSINVFLGKEKIEVIKPKVILHEFDVLRKNIRNGHYSNNIDYEHAKRVWKIVTNDPRFTLLNTDDRIMVSSIAVAHDVVEDSKCSVGYVASCFKTEEAVKTFSDAITLLTHDKKLMSYPEYIKNIMDSKNLFAIMVKQADMADHLAQKETLTDYLKNKYYPVLPLLLET